MSSEQKIKLSQRTTVGSLDLPTCKNCLRRIQRDQPRQWSTDPHKLGLIHVVCPDIY